MYTGLIYLSKELTDCVCDKPVDVDKEDPNDLLMDGIGLGPHSIMNSWLQYGYGKIGAGQLAPKMIGWLLIRCTKARMLAEDTNEAQAVKKILTKYACSNVRKN